MYMLLCRKVLTFRCLTYLDNLHFEFFVILRLKLEMTIFEHFSHILSQIHSQWVHNSILLMQLKTKSLWLSRLRDEHVPFFGTWLNVLKLLSLKVPTYVQMGVTRSLAITSYNKWCNVHHMVIVFPTPISRVIFWVFGSTETSSQLLKILKLPDKFRDTSGPLDLVRCKI